MRGELSVNGNTLAQERSDHQTVNENSCVAVPQLCGAPCSTSPALDNARAQTMRCCLSSAKNVLQISNMAI